MTTHMRHTTGTGAPTALCNPALTAPLNGDVDAVTCGACREEAGRAIAEQETMRWQANLADD